MQQLLSFRIYGLIFISYALRCEVEFLLLPPKEAALPQHKIGRAHV